MIESSSSGVLVYQKQVHAEDSSMRTLEGGRMDAPTTGVCGKGKGSTGRGANSPGRGGGSRGGGVAGSPGRGSAPAAQRILPPCRVCGLTATGFHYGANTCEACKAFFRRMVGRPAPPHYSCQGNCQPDPERGLSCPHCRLQRCQAVGMSLKAVKRGRYTHERKAQNILEVKQLSSPPPGPVQQNYDINSNTIKEPGYSWSTLPTSSTPVRAPACVSPIPSPGSSNASYSDSGLSPGYTPPGPQGFSAPPTMQHNPPPGPAVSPRDAEMDALVEKMVAVHRKYDELKPEHFKDRVAVEAKYKEERKLLQEMFGSMKPLDVEEYCRIYTETGVDVDGRLQEFIQRVVPLMEHRMYAHCAFLKALPGFKQLSSQDQIALMKGSQLEDHIWSVYRTANPKMKTYYNPYLNLFLEPTYIQSMYNEYFVKRIFSHTHKMQECSITEEEQVLMRAVCNLQSDRCVTAEASNIVAEVCLLMVTALKNRLKKTHPHRPNILGKLLLMLTDIRELSHIYVHDSHQKLTEYQEIANTINPLLKESWTPEGSVYGIFSNEIIKHMCDSSKLDAVGDRSKEDKSQVQRRDHRLSLDINSFRFFVPPGRTDNFAIGDPMSQYEQPLNLSTDANNFM